MHCRCFAGLCYGWRSGALSGLAAGCQLLLRACRRGGLPGMTQNRRLWIVAGGSAGRCGWNLWLSVALAMNGGRWHGWGWPRWRGRLAGRGECWCARCPEPAAQAHFALFARGGRLGCGASGQNGRFPGKLLTRGPVGTDITPQFFKTDCRERVKTWISVSVTSGGE
jgi:hypothetical protein